MRFAVSASACAFMLGVIGTLSGCPDSTATDTTPTPTTCADGQLNCPCVDGTTCSEGLTCATGFCIEDTTTPCPEGSEGCACYANSTCDAKDGVAMACVDDVCVDATVVEPGGLGDPCNDTNPCGTDNGTQLECADGTCALPVTCPEGTAGCACLAGDTCSDDLICTGGVCFEPTCTAGTLNCPCDTGNVCSGELSCDEGVCKEPTVTISEGLSVSNPDVRSCQLVIEVEDIEATFDASVLGRTKRDGGRLAVVFSSTSDVGPTTVATFTPATSLSSAALSNVTCYDRLGQPVDSPGVSLSN